MQGLEPACRITPSCPLGVLCEVFTELLPRAGRVDLVLGDAQVVEEGAAEVPLFLRRVVDASSDAVARVPRA